MSTTADAPVLSTPVFPYYVDEEMVMSFLATVDDGISIVRKVSQTVEDKHNGSVEGSAEANTRWMPFSLGGKIKGVRGTSQVSGEAWEFERQYPLISLLNLLRERLFELKVVKSIDDDPDAHLAVGDIVEFSGPVQKNPLSRLSEVWESYLAMRVHFEDSQPKVSPRQQGNGRSSTQSGNGKRALSPDEAKLQSIIDIASKGVESTGLLDVRVPMDHSEFANAVLTLRTERDPAQAIAFSRGSLCKVIGKITGITDVGDSTQLYRRSGLDFFPSSVMGEIFATMKNLPGLDLDLDEIIIPGPAIQILPLAIFI